MEANPLLFLKITMDVHLLLHVLREREKKCP